MTSLQLTADSDLASAHQHIFCTGLQLIETHAEPVVAHANAGNNSPQIAPPTGAPAMVVPMGFTAGGLPGSLQILARPFDEANMIRAAYGYEQATQHRTCVPSSAPWSSLPVCALDFYRGVQVLFGGK